MNKTPRQDKLDNVLVGMGLAFIVALIVAFIASVAP